MPADASDGAAADPDGAVAVNRDVNAAGATERGTLTGDVGRGRAAAIKEPLGERCVQASGHRIFGCRPVLWKESPDLERGRSTLGVRSDDPDLEVDKARLECENGVGARE